LDSSEHFLAAQKDLAEHGVQVKDVQLNLPKMMARKEKIVKDLTGGIGFLFKKNNITSFKGLGAFKSSTEVEVTAASGEKTSIATGSVVNELAALPLDGTTVVSSTGALSLPKVPATFVVIGGGYIGLEMGSVWLRLGSQVTVIEYADHICGTMDLQISKRLLQILKKQGMNFILEAKVIGSAKTANGMSVEYELKDGTRQNINAEVVLVAAGRKPSTTGLRVDAAGVQLDPRGSVLVDEHFRTNVPGIYAIGDVIRGPMLAHKAEEEGVAVAEIIAGQAGHVNYETVPGIIYTWPEVASVGKTEEQLKADGVAYKVGTFPFTPNGRAKALGFTEGLVKVLADKTTDRLLGVHILGPRASDIIAEAVVAMEFGGSAEDLARSFHGHPTLSEALREAALAVDNRARQT
jgi:dihydrolipoamide dehydrogenase